MEIENALIIISKYYNTHVDILDKALRDTFKLNTKEISKQKREIILPYCGKIFAEKCKGIVFNHGLYTQCTEIINDKHEFCKKCVLQKYGRIEDRNNFKLGEFISKKGKKELSYNIFMQKMQYSYDDVTLELKRHDLEYNLIDNSNIKNKKGRGRPRKIDTTIDDNIAISVENETTIEVLKIYLNGKAYLKTKENVLLDENSYEIVGMYNSNNEHNKKE